VLLRATHLEPERSASCQSASATCTDLPGSPAAHSSHVSGPGPFVNRLSTGCVVAGHTNTNPQLRHFAVPRNEHVVASLVEQFERVERAKCTKATMTHVRRGSSAKVFGPALRAVHIDLTFAAIASGIAL